MNTTNISDIELTQDEALRPDVSALLESFRLTAQAASSAVAAHGDAADQQPAIVCMRDPYFSFELI